MRLDVYLYEISKYPSRNKASEAIERGEVLYNGKQCKPSQIVTDFNKITYLSGANFVSNGAFKLEKALTDFNFDVSGMTFADIGASNGGFTQCLLNHGAKKVFAIDVGESQLDKSLQSNKNVVVIDNFNARNLTKNTLGELVDGVVADVSFISLAYILDAIHAVLTDNGYAFLLIKPQFECGKEYLGKSGIVKNPRARLNACLKIYNYCLNIGLVPTNFTVAPIREKKNVEYIIMLQKNIDQKPISIKNIERLI